MYEDALKTIETFENRLKFFNEQLKNRENLPLWFVKQLEKNRLICKSVILEQKTTIGILINRGYINKDSSSK